MMEDIAKPKTRSSSEAGYKRGRIPRNQKYDHMFKVIIIGDPCCGKTSMLMR